MDKNKWEGLATGLFIGGMAMMIWGAGYSTGWSKGNFDGYKRSDEDQKRAECVVKFGNSPRNEISGNCLRFFETK